MYRAEWNKIEKELKKYLYADATIKYAGYIYDEFTRMLPAEGMDEYYSDPDYNRNAVLTVLVGPFDEKDELSMNQCLENLMNALEQLRYVVDRHPHGRIINGQITWDICFKKTITYLYLIDEEEKNGEQIE